MISRPLALTFVGFAALGAAVLGAFVYERTRAPSAPARPTIATIPATAARAPATAAGPAPETVPTLRPVFALPDLQGKTHSITEWDGKPLIVNFWATWCAPCRREMPLLNRIKREYAPKGVEIVGIAVDIAADVKTYVAKFPVDYSVLIGDQDGLDAARDFGVTDPVFPFTAFIDAKGRILMIHVGELHEPTARAILGVVLRADTGALGPEAARAAVKAALAELPPDDPTQGG